MLGAIAGDIIGSVYEHSPIKSTNFPLFSDHSRFTDDTVLTIAIADAILEGKNYAAVLRATARRFPNAGYGGFFWRWIQNSEAAPYQSWGNGSAMRVSPVGFAFGSIDSVLLHARRSAEVTHNHPDGIAGAQAVALAVFLALQGAGKEHIRKEISGHFGYDLNRTLEEIRPWYRFDVSCRGSVPEAIIAFLESTSIEGALRNAVSLGGDSDTLACIAGAIAEAHYGDLPAEIETEVRRRLPQTFNTIIDRFRNRFLT